MVVEPKSVLLAGINLVVEPKSVLLAGINLAVQYCMRVRILVDFNLVVVI